MSQINVTNLQDIGVYEKQIQLNNTILKLQKEIKLLKQCIQELNGNYGIRQEYINKRLEEIT